MHTINYVRLQTRFYYEPLTMNYKQEFVLWTNSKAGNGIRTRDPHLGKVML